VKNFLQGQPGVVEGIAAYVKEVKAKTFPAAEHTF
jgi:3-methyl-2-oxobutanoate hydroxymethyltransferase